MPYCTEVLCGPPPELPRAQTALKVGTVTVNARVPYRCDKGFIVSIIPASTTFDISCVLSGRKGIYVIPPPEEQCKPARCSTVPDVEHGHVDSDQTVWRYLDKVPFRCDSGYALGGVKHETKFFGSCDANGVWTINDDPKCSPVVCANKPIDIPQYMQEYARIVPSTSIYPILSNQTLTLECVPGAIVTNSSGSASKFDITCGDDGEFFSDGVCAIPCPVVPKVPYSSSKWFGKSIEFGGSGASIFCKEGYTTYFGGQSNQTIICDRNGTLSKIDPCLPADLSRNPDGSGGAVPIEPTDWPYEASESFNVYAYMKRILQDSRGAGSHTSTLILFTVLVAII
jgi:hypothetical protein